MDRRKIAKNSTLLLAMLDLFKAAQNLNHDDSICTVAAAMASMPTDDRKLFREAFDSIELEMHRHRPV